MSATSSAQDVAKLDAVLGEHRGQERNLRNTLLTAQKLADEIKEQAQNEAAIIVREVEAAPTSCCRSQSRLDEVQREIDGLRMKRREVENDIEALVRTLTTTLEFIRHQDVRSREERVLLHRPRQAETGPAPAAPRPAEITPKAETGTAPRAGSPYFTTVSLTLTR